MEGPMRVLPQQIRQQLGSVLRAWGMSEPHAETTAEVMTETDLRGVDSHGISMLPTYDREFRSGRLKRGNQHFLCALVIVKRYNIFIASRTWR